MESANNISVSNIHQQTNHRIYERNVPSQTLQSYLDVRPVMTKYSYFPIVEPRTKPQVPLNKIPTFNINNTFNPGNSKSPWSGFASNINVESDLKNQIYALQKCSQSVYVPSSKSDLYENNFPIKNNINPHGLLFEESTFCNFDPNPNSEIVGASLFLNSTRTQIKDLTKMKH
jgi:hypothetical protein